MTTLLSLVDEEKLIRHDPELPPNVQPERIIFLHPRVPEQIETRIAAHPSTWNLEISPEEQLDELLSSFCEGGELTYGWHFRDMHPHGDDVWELKRPDVRLFGWFQTKDCFVIVAADAVWKLKQYKGLYLSYVRLVVEDRAALVEEGSWVKGIDPNEVVSNWRETPPPIGR